MRTPAVAGTGVTAPSPAVVGTEVTAGTLVGAGTAAGTPAVAGRPVAVGRRAAVAVAGVDAAEAADTGQLSFAAHHPSQCRPRRGTRRTKASGGRPTAQKECARRAPRLNS